MHGDDLSEWVKLAQIYLTLPTTSVSNERSFSIMNLIKDALRNRLSTFHLNVCMRLARSSCTYKDYPRARAYEIWEAARKRRFADA